MGRLLILLGIALVVLGVIVAAMEHSAGAGGAQSGVSGWLSRLPFGRLPGDIRYRGRHVTVFAPLGTSLLLSVILTLVLVALAKLRR